MPADESFLVAARVLMGESRVASTQLGGVAAKL
jgi:hypothetical protein